MTPLFVYGTLRHRPLLDTVLGRPDARADAARLPGHQVHWAAGQNFPYIQEGAQGAEGLLLSDLSDEDMARLDFYEGGFGYDTRVLDVMTASGAVPARVYFARPGLWEAGALWDLGDWVRDHGALSVSAAQEVMELLGTITPAEVARRFPFIRARAWSRMLAATGAQGAARRSPAGEAAPEFSDRPGGFDGFFRLRPVSSSFRRFDGTRSQTVEREVFQGFDAALVLPYDPVRERVLLVEQFRLGPALRGDPHARILEPIAGMVDAGETPADAARREAREEAGIALGHLEHMTSVYASPGYSTDFFHCYLAECDLDIDGGRIGGHPEEDEDIRTHVLPLAEALDLVDSGEINVAPLTMMLLWLNRRVHQQSGGRA